MVRIKLEEDRMGNAAGLEGEAAVVIITEKEKNGKMRTGVALAGGMKPLEFAAVTGEAMRSALKTIAKESIFPEELLMDIFLSTFNSGRGGVMLKRPREENLTKIIRWEDGSLQCFHGTMEEAREFARKKEQETGKRCDAII